MDAMIWSKGVISTDAGACIARPRMLLKELLSISTGESAQITEPSAGYQRLALGTVTIDGYGCSVVTGFHSEVIRQVNIELTKESLEWLRIDPNPWPPPDGPYVTFLREWVRRRAGKVPPLSFRWGDIADTYDPIGGFARIRFNYKSNLLRF
jgi:hypothetical protein